MIWDKLSKKEKIGLSVAFAFLALAFLDRLLISPVRTKFNALNLQIRISEKQLGGDMRNINQKNSSAKSTNNISRISGAAARTKRKWRRSLGRSKRWRENLPFIWWT